LELGSAAQTYFLNFRIIIGMKKSRPDRRAEASVPTGLDAYTEVPSTKEGMSDSDKFKEGYKKKGKGKVKNPPKKVEEPMEETTEEPEEQEAWDDGVVDSWDTLEVEEMPVPVKVKKEMRKEEKKRKKDLEKAAKAQDSPEMGEPAAEASPTPEKVEAPAATLEAKPVASAADEVAGAVKNMAITDEAPVAGAGKKDLNTEEKAAVKADREAKKAAKAAQRAAAKQNAVEPAAERAGEPAGRPAATRTAGPPAATAKEAEGEGKATTKAERRAKQEAQRASKAASQVMGTSEPGFLRFPSQLFIISDLQEQKPKAESKIRVPDEMKADDKKTEKKLAKTLSSHKVSVGITGWRPRPPDPGPGPDSGPAADPSLLPPAPGPSTPTHCQFK
jgi:hypothetical protein